MHRLPQLRIFSFVIFFGLICVAPLTRLQAQDYVTGAFEGQVTDTVTGAPVAGATIQIINKDTGVPVARQTDSQGRFRQGLLPPGDYTIRVSRQGYVTYEGEQSLPALRPTSVVPVPVKLQAEVAAVPTPSPTEASTPGDVAKTQTPPTTGQSVSSPTPSSILAEINTTDAQRGGAFTEKEVSTLPLGGTTLTRTFDELGLLLPGVAPPPQTLGSVAGPGVGAGVGSAGQFAVNGLRSRANNFTVDGSDNNDEDIGVRRQGFFALVPQPIESIREFQMITLLAPAQYGHNLGAQVNAISKSGGNQFHGTLSGLFNSSQLNARNFFDTANGTATQALRSQTGQAVLDCTGVSDAACIARNTPISVTNQSAGEDSFTLGQAGFTLGGPIKEKTFFFISYERQMLSAVKEASFAVPTVDQRGIFNSGATGFFIDCLDADPGFNLANCNLANRNHFFQDFGFPTEVHGDAIFSLFPYPNNPNGVFGSNTFTTGLPAGASGNVASGKYDQLFNLWGKPQSFTARYNFTQDRRDIPVTGEALFSSLRPRVRTQNFSTFLTSELSSTLSNVLRLSYGRTRLVFDELRNPFLIPSQVSSTQPFLLNAPRLQNDTLPLGAGLPNTGPVLIRRLGTTECGGANDCVFGNGIGRVGQVNVAGFSPIGVDVDSFPQSRVNNTYQIADALSYRRGSHSITAGIDIRRVELNSDLPRNSRTRLTFNGSPELDFDPSHPEIFTGNFLTGADLAAAGAPSGAFLSLANSGSEIGLRYHEFNGFGQDEWRIRPNLTINFGLRYEYNTPPREVHNLIEGTFTDAALNDPNVSDLNQFLAGRTGIFDPDRNNFAPRIGLAWSPNWFGQDRSTVLRAGYGVFSDQILGAVVSQSRNVFPNFVTVNTGGFNGVVDGLNQFTFFNPARGGICFGVNCANFVPLVQPGTLNAFNPNLTLADVLSTFASGQTFPNAISITLPDRSIKTPSAEQFSVTFEQQLTANMVLSAAYVGTRGHNLLRASTPNLGPNNVLIAFDAGAAAYGTLQPIVLGVALAPGSTTTTNFDRPFPNIGPVSIYKSSAGSSYDALQLQLRGRYNLLGPTQFQVNYTYGKTTDDASDVFDLAGAPALAQNSLTLAGELGPSNFDVRHRFSSNYIADLSSWGKNNSFLHAIFNGLEVAGTGTFQTGQPFTVNSIFDVNLDGNLTDRLNSTNGIVATGDRSQPFRLTVDPTTLLAPVGQDGAINRNSFRSSNLWVTNASMIKTISFSETKKLVFRAEAFNLFDRSNFGIPVRFLEAPGFGRATDTVTPGRRIQFGLKLLF